MISGLRHGVAEAGEVEGLEETHQLINCICQGKEVLLDCEVENVPVFHVGRDCQDRIINGHDSLLQKRHRSLSSSLPTC